MIYILNVDSKMERATGCSILVSTFSMVNHFGVPLVLWDQLELLLRSFAPSDSHFTSNDNFTLNHTSTSTSLPFS